MPKIWDAVIIALIVIVFGTIAFGVAFELELESDSERDVEFKAAAETLT